MLVVILCGGIVIIILLIILLYIRRLRINISEMPDETPHDAPKKTMEEIIDKKPPKITEPEPVVDTPDKDLDGVIVFYSQPEEKTKSWSCRECGASNPTKQSICQVCGHAK